MVDLFPLCAQYAKLFITLHRVDPVETYNYKAREMFGLPVIHHTRHLPKCKNGDSWLYFAVPAGANLASLEKGSKLYVGCQTQDRMYRGDGMGAENYHHGQMRSGNGDDTPVNYLRTSGEVQIFLVDPSDLTRHIARDEKYAELRKIAEQPRKGKKHPGYWYEQYLLMTQGEDWRWNTAGAESAILDLFGMSNNKLFGLVRRTR